MQLSAQLRAPPGARAPCARAPSSRRVPLAAVRYSQEPAAAGARRERDASGDDDPLLDLLRSAVPLATLDRTEEALAEYCAGKGPQHLEVLQYYREKRATAQRGCMLELEEQQQQQQRLQRSGAAAAASSPSPSSPACASLAQLERLLHETSYSGDAAHLYRVLAAQRATEARQHDAAPSSSSSSPAAAAAAAAANADDALRARALRLFHLADANRDAKVDREEFLSAMRVMDAELSDAELGAVFSALDAHCSLTAAQFVDAVTASTQLAAALAEASVDDTPDGEEEEEGRRGQAFLKEHVRRHSPEGTPSASDADVLRRVRHSRPTWWSDAPGYLDNSS